MLQKIKKFELIVLLLLLCVCLSASNKKEGKNNIKIHYNANWKDLNTYPKADWVSQMKFGMYWHWGLNSIPGYSGWYGNGMYKKGSAVYKYHLENYGDPSVFGYKDFVKLFTAKKFNAKEWVSDAKYIGAKFVLGQAYHHDGFSLYKDSYTPWNSVNMNPHIDIIGELKKEAESQGLKFGATSHLAYHWKFFSDELYPNNFDADSAPELYNVQDPSKGPTEKWVKEWYNRTIELIDKYNLDMLWFDFGTRRKEYSKYTPKVAAHFYNNGVKNNKIVALDTKMGFQNDKSGVYDIEDGKFTYIRTPSWMADCTFNDKWFYIRGKKRTPEMYNGKYWLYQLIDIVSKNGTLLLNVGPQADGSWVPEWKKELFKIGDWIKVNGKAIYNTKPWHRFGEGPTANGENHGHGLGHNLTPDDVRFTTRKDTLFAIVCGWHNEPFLIKSLSEKDINGVKIKDVSMFGTKQKINWKQTTDGLVLNFPMEQPCEMAYVFAIKGDNMFPKRDEYIPLYLDLDSAKVCDNIRIERNGKIGKIELSDINIIAYPKYPRLGTIDAGLTSKISVSSCAKGCNVSMLNDAFTNGNKITSQVFSTKKSEKPYINIKLAKSYHLENMYIFGAMDSYKDLKENTIVKFYNKGKLITTKTLKNDSYIEH